MLKSRNNILTIKNRNYYNFARLMWVLPHLLRKHPWICTKITVVNQKLLFMIDALTTNWLFYKFGTVK